MNELVDYEYGDLKPKRPTFLKVLCILSYISLGFAGIGLIITLLNGKPNPSEVEKGHTELIKMANELRGQKQTWLAGMLEQTADLATYQQANYWPLVGINAIVVLTGFLGVSYMWRGRKVGFHFYIIYCLISAGGLYLIAPANVIPAFTTISGLFVSGIFVLLYGLNLKHLK